MKSIKLRALVVAAGILTAGFIASAQRASDALKFDAARIERDVVYGSAGGVDLLLDLYHPRKSAPGPRVVLVYVHGGAWTMGDKGGSAGSLAIPVLLRRGYLIASINYRLSPRFKFPAHIEDVKCAVRYLRAHAEELDLDPKRIGAWGGSAGGHLVALLGTADASAGFDASGGWTNYSSRVQAVVDLYGPADLTLGNGRDNRRLGQTVFGAQSADDPILKRASPVTYASKDDPPFLILHGDKDSLVPINQAERLQATLEQVGVPVSLVVVTNAGHGFVMSGGIPKPSRTQMGRIIADFFDKHLRN